MFKKFSIYIFVGKLYKMGCLEGSGVPVLCIGRAVPKGLGHRRAQLSSASRWKPKVTRKKDYFFCGVIWLV
jgi:hypothetical protein